MGGVLPIIRVLATARGSDGNDISLPPVALCLLSWGTRWTLHASDFSTSVFSCARRRQTVLVYARQKTEMEKFNALELQRFPKLRPGVIVPPVSPE